MKREEITHIFVVISRTGQDTPGYGMAKEKILFDHASRLPIYFQEYEAIKLSKRIPNTLVRKIRFDLFDWDISNSGKTVFSNLKTDR